MTRFAAVPFASVAMLALLTGCGGSGDKSGSEAASLEGRPWVVTSGIDVPEEASAARPSALFENGIVGGSTGCNRFTAGYTLDGDSIDVGQIASTRMACLPPADAIEKAYLAAFGKVSGWRVDGDKLVLLDADRNELLRYAAATPVGEWEATAILQGDAFASPLPGTKLTAGFGSDGKLSGSAGCNRYTASYTTDKGAIEITKPAATRKLCPAPAGIMEQEAAYLSVLPAAVSYRVDEHSLELLSADGTGLASYIRAGG